MLNDVGVQERDEKTKFSASHMPPDGFTLNESLSATKSARNGKLGIGIEANALRVGKYMSKLEDYLQVTILPHANLQCD